MARLEKEERKLNHLLTLSLNYVEAAMLFLEDFSQRVEKEYKRAEQKGTGDPKVRKNDRDWISRLKLSYKQINNHLSGIQKQYTHYFEPQLNKVFMDKETKEYDVQSYDDHMSDAYELARLGMIYFEKAYLSKPNADAVFILLDSMKGVGVMEQSDYARYNLNR